MFSTAMLGKCPRTEREEADPYQPLGVPGVQNLAHPWRLQPRRPSWTWPRPACSYTIIPAVCRRLCLGIRTPQVKESKAKEPFLSPPNSSIARTTSLASVTIVTNSFLSEGGKCEFALSTLRRSEFNKARKARSIWAWEGRRPASRAPVISATLSAYRATVSSRSRGPDLGSRGSLSGDSSLLQQEEQAPMVRRTRVVKTRDLERSSFPIPYDKSLDRG